MAKTLPKQTNYDDLSYAGLIKILWKFLGKDRWWYVFYISIMGLGAVSVYYKLFLVGKIAEILTRSNQPDFNLNQIYIYTFLFLLIGVLAAIGTRFANYYGRVLQVNSISDLKKQVLIKIQKYDLKWHQKENSGNKIAKIQNGIGKYRQILNLFRRSMLSQIIGIVTICLSFVFVNFYIFFIVVTYTGVIYFVSQLLRKKIKQTESNLNKLKEKNSGKMFESYNNITTLKVTGAEARIRSRLIEIENDTVTQEHNLSFYQGSKNLYVTIVDYIFGVIILGILVWATINGNLSAPLFIVYFGFFARLQTQIRGLIDIDEELDICVLGIARLMPVLEEEPDVYFGDKAFDTSWNCLEFKDVNFSYQSPEYNKINLANLNLIINRGEKIGVVGRSGSGKSTLVKILMGLYKVQEDNGSITYKSTSQSTNFYDIDYQNLTQNQAVVLQDTELFNMSLKENITMLKVVSSEQLTRAIEISQLELVIKDLPDGIETKVGEKGYKLSGGQRQRVGIARSICSGADFLIFDEATSALDSQTELDIAQALESNLKDKTMLVVAHRLSTLRNMDRIIVFEDGKIVESGKFNDLIKDPSSHFSKLWELQKSGVEL